MTPGRRTNAKADEPAKEQKFSAVRTRLVSLLLALADNPEGLRKDWILRTVRGYNTVAADSADRYLRDDVPALAADGITITWDDNDILRLDRSTWRDEDPGFTEEEAGVLAMASQVAFSDESLGEVTRDAWAKLAPVAQRSNLVDGRGTIIFGDRITLDREQFAALNRATQPPRKRIEFFYAPQVFGEEVQRSIEPWQMVNLKGRLYVVGHDVDRDAVRVFRIARMRDITVTDVDAAQPFPDGDVQAIAERALNRGAAPLRAVVTLDDDSSPGPCADVLAGARELGDGRYEIGPLTTAELMDIGLEHAGDLIVEEPVEVRDEIVARLRAIVAADGGSPNATSTDSATTDATSGNAAGEEHR
ncbi:helix-turn-helix transcriptional regulator [Corynebacterium freneyi]|uniref:helix-turn-helix transcriptional regulator n=1 Tax=Corynebacterium freneyi TaxID=134034 RepID=UPI00068CEB57|nr:WYL domain-containing protein [Corynebacterium freneyi]